MLVESNYQTALSCLSLLFTLTNRVTRLLDSLALNARQEARKRGVSGTSYFRPLSSRQPGETWYPKPVTAISVPTWPFLQLSGTLNQVHWLIEYRVKQPSV